MFQIRLIEIKLFTLLSKFFNVFKNNFPTFIVVLTICLYRQILKIQSAINIIHLSFDKLSDLFRMLFTKQHFRFLETNYQTLNTRIDKQLQIFRQSIISHYQNMIALIPHPPSQILLILFLQ